MRTNKLLSLCAALLLSTIAVPAFALPGAELSMVSANPTAYDFTPATAPSSLHVAPEAATGVDFGGSIALRSTYSFSDASYASESRRSDSTSTSARHRRSLVTGETVAGWRSTA